MKKKIIWVVIGALSALICAACSLETVEVNRGTAFVEPYVSMPPASRVFKPGEYTTPITLTAVIWSWNEGRKDGALTYQWYSFNSIQEYLDNGGEGTPIPGADGDAVPLSEEDSEIVLSYTLPSIDTTAGKKYYYYVEITNVNEKANDKTEGSIRSEVAIISFINDNTAEHPIITRHPASNSYRFGSSMAPLEVKIKKMADSGDMQRYQWFTSPADKFEDVILSEGTPISQATLEVYLANPRSMTLEGNYYWVEITNTGTGADSKETSIPAQIWLDRALRAQAPRIVQEPRDRLYFVNQTDAKSPIELNAESPDFGELTYQWYSNTSASNTGGTILTGQTDESLTPPIVLTSAGSAYYYVVITNTNENVENPANSTATRSSKAVRVSVQAPNATPANATVTLSDPTGPENRYQYIRGYGGMNVGWNNFPNETAADTRTMYGNGPNQLGFNIMRIMIMPWNTDINVMMRDLVNGDRPDYYESVKIVNANGGYVLASPWSSPKEWKTNNSINGGGKLRESYYQLFANYLKNFARHMYEKGAPIYAISIANEPNYTAGYDGCEWDPVEMRDFYKKVGHFTNGVRGFGGGVETPVVLTVNGESANNPDINFSALRDPVSRAVIDFYARHVYGSQTSTLWRDPSVDRETYADWRQGSQYQTECWMTEHNINSANATAYPNDSTWNYVWRFMNDIDLVMRINNENAFVWWASKRFYSMLGDGQFTTRNGVPTVRGWGLSHYAKYTIHTTRIGLSVSGTTNSGATITQGSSDSTVNSSNFALDNLSAKITAYVPYVEPVSLVDGIPSEYPVPEEITMIMWTPTLPSGGSGTNMGRIEIKMPDGFLIGSASAVRTNSGEIMQDYQVTVNADRDTAYINLPASTLVSLRFTK
jgi:O-glycosyl hydrolase